jgi:hypothetical protein
VFPISNFYAVYAIFGGMPQNELAMTMHGKIDRSPDDDGQGSAPTFPSASTFLGIALVFIVLWLLATGARELLPASPDAPVPARTSEFLGTK